MIGYYQRFIPNFACIGGPLFQLLQKKVPFQWSPKCQQAFKELLNLIATASTLWYPDFSRKFIVQTDASLSAIGAILSQIDDKDKEHPVAYCSCTLDVHKRNYTMTKKECLAVIYACKQFRVYIHGTHFQVVTNHASLRWLRNLREPEGRLARWALKMQAYDYKIVH